MTVIEHKAQKTVFKTEGKHDAKDHGGVAMAAHSTSSKITKRITPTQRHAKKGKESKDYECCMPAKRAQKSPFPLSCAWEVKQERERL